MADEIVKYKNKVSGLLGHADSITAKELKTCPDLNVYKDWFTKLIKATNKLQETVDSDFVQQFNQMSNAQT